MNVIAIPGRGPAGAPIVRRLIGFLRLLRDNGFTVGIAEALDTARMARGLDLSDRHGFRWALRALLCASQSEWRRFDALYDLHWRGRGLKRAAPAKDTAAAGAGQRPARGAATLPPDLSGLADRVERGVAEDDAGGARRRDGASEAESLAATDLRHIADADSMRRVHDLAERLAARMRYRITRRRRAHNRGRSLDLRRTIHESVRFGGTPLRLKYRRRKPKPVRLVMILDASGSMNLYSGFFMRFMRGVVRCFKETEAFVLHTRLAHISPALRERDLERALERMAILASGWSGGTKIGECLRRFNDTYAAKAINSRTIVVIMSDGYDTGPPELLGEEMRRLKRRARRVVWLNPLIGWDSYRPVAGGMAAALPHIDLFAPAHNLESLAALEDALVRL